MLTEEDRNNTTYSGF